MPRAVPNNKLVRTAAVVLALAATLVPLTEVQAQDLPVDPSVYASMQWRGIGPFRGGRSVASTGVVGDPLTYYMGTVGGGVWKTTDAGTTWRNVSDGQLGTSSVGAVAVADELRKGP